MLGLADFDMPKLPSFDVRMNTILRVVTEITVGVDRALAAEVLPKSPTKLRASAAELVRESAELRKEIAGSTEAMRPMRATIESWAVLVKFENLGPLQKFLGDFEGISRLANRLRDRASKLRDRVLADKALLEVAGIREALEGVVTAANEFLGVVTATLEALEDLVDVLHADHSLAEDAVVSHADLRTRLAL